jgi:predicted ArsR family transcriptional regulator
MTIEQDTAEAVAAGHKALRAYNRAVEDMEGAIEAIEALGVLGEDAEDAAIEAIEDWRTMMGGENANEKAERLASYVAGLEG